MQQDFDPIEKLFQSNKAAPLSPTEKAKLRMNLSSFIEKNPVQARRFDFFSARLFRFRPVLGGFIVACLFSSVSLASAQSALPGDALYDLKLLVNESVPMLFMDAQQKQNFATQRIDNRLEEAEKLQEKGGLTVEQKEVLQAKLDECFETITSKEVTVDTHEELTSVLEQHQEVLPVFTVAAEVVELETKPEIDPTLETEVEAETDSETDPETVESPQETHTPIEPSTAPAESTEPKKDFTLQDFFELTQKPVEVVVPVDTDPVTPVLEPTEVDSSIDTSVITEPDPNEEPTIDEGKTDGEGRGGLLPTTVNGVDINMGGKR